MTNNSGEQEQFGKRSESPLRPGGQKSAGEALRTGRFARRSRHSRNRFVVFFNFLLSCVVLALVAAGVVFYIGKHEFDAPGPTSEAQKVMVQPNTGVGQIASTLESEGVISDARIFRLGVRAYGNDDSLKAGEYEIKAGASMRDIMDLLKSGKSVMYSLTVPEGLTVEQAFDRIRDTGELTGDMPSNFPPEGSLAADTVRFTRGTPRQQVIDKLKAEQKKRVEAAWEGREKDLPIDSIEDFVTLASIVEKETGVAEERPQVAAVFINRLKKGMRLQSDPTIIYGLYGGKGKPADKPIYQSDLDKKTAYNTYQIDGLPPTPIATPGQAALDAVAHPAKSDALYFVADGTGGHVFSSSLDEHNENVARWRALQKKLKAAPDGGGDDAAAKD